MSTTIATDHATPQQDGSLESAAKAFEAFDGLLSVPEKEQPPKRQPEQRTKKEPSAEQAPAAPEGDEEEETTPESEPAKEGDEAEGEAEAVAQPETYTVKIDGQDVTVTRDELLNGYSRQQDYTKKTMELARQRKEFEERELSAVRTEREQYRMSLHQIEQVLTDIAPSEPNWTQLRQTLSPEGFADAVQAWQDNRTKLNEVRAERERVESQQREDAQKGFKSFLETQQTKLIEADPDFGDPTRAPSLKQDLGTFAQARGFTADELAQVADHRLVLLLRDAMRYQQQKAKAPAVKNKIEQSIAAAEPGGSRANQPKPSKSDQALQRLRQTGSVDDAAAAFMDRI